jgi:hypothetical protein
MLEASTVLGAKLSTGRLPVKIIHICILFLASLISTRGAVFDYAVTLSGSNEFPTNNSSGLGAGIVNYNDSTHMLDLAVTFTGLSSGVTISHIHGPTASPFTGTAGVATTTPTFAGFPSGVTSGAFAAALDLTQASSYNPAFVTANGGTTAGAESALAAAMASGEAYWNIHTTAFPGGEIRGFLVPIPEPSTLALLGLGTFGLALIARSRRGAATS